MKSFVHTLDARPYRSEWCPFTYCTRISQQITINGHWCKCVTRLMAPNWKILRLRSTAGPSSTKLTFLEWQYYLFRLNIHFCKLSILFFCSKIEMFNDGEWSIFWWLMIQINLKNNSTINGEKKWKINGKYWILCVCVYVRRIYHCKCVKMNVTENRYRLYRGAVFTMCAEHAQWTRRKFDIQHHDLNEYNVLSRMSLTQQVSISIKSNPKSVP